MTVFWRRPALNALMFLTKNSARIPLLILLTSILIATTVLAEDASPKEAKGDKEKVVRQVIDKWVQMGTEQYNRGFYSDSETYFLRAKDYEGYLNKEERDKLNESIQRAHKAALEREAALATMRSAGQLAEQQKLTEAKMQLQAVQTSEFLSEEERQSIKERLETIDKMIAQEQPEKDTTPAAQPAVTKIEEPSAPVEQPKEQPVMTTADAKHAAEFYVAATEAKSPAAEQGEPQDQQSGYITVINRRRNVIRGMVKAVVNDAVEKADRLLADGECEKAMQVVEDAQNVVYENQQHLGDYLFNQYTGQLGQLSEKIAEQEKLLARQNEEQRRIKAEQTQQEYKDRMAAAREKRVADLMQHALHFQKQKRYEEALAQIEMLLLIDPQHNQALILKDTLEDMISFRKQLEVAKEKGRERVGMAIETEKSTIPYPEEMTYPKTWLEIISKPTRKPEEAVGQNPANMAVEKQLDEVVDLPGLSPEMPIREAIKVISNSVDPPLKILVNWGDLYNNANIDQTTPINMDPLMGVRLGAALDLLLQSVSAGVAQLKYIIKDGVINIATRQTLPTQMEVRVYDVSILISRPADYYVSAAGGGGAGGGGGGGRGGGMGAGGGGGGGSQYFAEYFEETEEELDRDTIRQEAQERINALVLLIQDTIDPTSWYDAGGEATITAYEIKKLVVLQTPENHRKIAELLQEMRKMLGHQVAIEARFLVVGENVLEEIGLDVFANINLGSHFGESTWQTESFEMTEPTPTGVPGSWDIGSNPVQFPPGYPSATNPQFISRGALMGFFGGRFGGILDHLEANFLIRATQAHADTESLVAPKVTVLSGESATLQVRRTIRYPLPPTISVSGGYGGGGTTAGGGGGGFGGGSTFQQNYGEIPTGPTLNITPTITTDRKHVLLNIVAELWDFLGFDTSQVETPIPGGVGGQPTDVFVYNVTLPQTERSRVKTRVSVPDGGTLLLGGLKRTASTEKEVGVPILSKIPVLGRFFTNRSNVGDQKVLLILVKPTIILQEEADAEAIAAMEGQL
jgi:type II secretory pathway component GspD/PulD (secretin)